MRHRKRGRHLSRTSSHRGALRRNLTISLFTYGRITTTLQKAKEVRSFAEKMITLAKKGLAKKATDPPAYVHYYRQALSSLHNKDIVKKLFGEGEWRESGGIASRYLTRNGGYTRILRLFGTRLGVLTGNTVGEISTLEYQMEGRNRKLRMLGNNLGDNAQRVIFELVEGPAEEQTAETEVKPKVSKGEEEKQD